MNDNILGRLLPCPFCGSSAEHYEQREFVGAKIWNHIRCVNHCCGIEIGRGSVVEAANKWNRRFVPPPINVSQKAALEALWNHSSGAFGAPSYTKMVIDPEQAIAALRSLGIEVKP